MRKYKRKVNPKKTHEKVPQDKLDTALHLIQTTNISVRGAAKQAGMNESTLRAIIKRNKKSGKDLETIQQLVSLESSGMQPSLPHDEEQVLAEAIRLRAKWGFGLSRSDVQDLVQDFVALHREKETPLGEHLRKYCQFKVVIYF